MYAVQLRPYNNAEIDYTLFLMSTAAPQSINAFTASTLPCAAALWRAVSPCCNIIHQVTIVQTIKPHKLASVRPVLPRWMITMFWWDTKFNNFHFERQLTDTAIRYLATSGVWLLQRIQSSTCNLHCYTPNSTATCQGYYACPLLHPIRSY